LTLRILIKGEKMEKYNDLKAIVKDKYAEIASKATSSPSENCGCGCCNESQSDFTIQQGDYRELDGYVAEADLNLGCGIPTQYAGIREGDTVLDLGSGAGNDVFVARSIVGESGKVVGLDMTIEMVEKAITNNKKMDYANVEFKLGDIEKIPLEGNSIDVVVSNCVLNLVPDKELAFREIFRVLKSGGHFCVSDIVIKGELPEDVRRSAELYAGCVSGAVEKSEYLNIIKNAGFKDVQVHTSKEIDLPDELLKKYLDEENLALLRESGLGIYSITVSGYKN
jgi:ubiquinone/menaquinone biosynthesis C-methylase UbiE